MSGEQTTQHFMQNVFSSQKDVFVDLRHENFDDSSLGLQQKLESISQSNSNLVNNKAEIRVSQITNCVGFGSCVPSCAGVVPKDDE
ncbi:predicted protein [Chaetoceros tenuissimus]|uniref:Uncharacterized protein n=1 Tax=Chaetoceros tenuissimus TaxID=426638 RepID=A0AAD3HDE1_9STRA|nr:predicted protein [Chaetoceros tenuissimus]